MKQTLIEVSETFQNSGLYIDKCLYSYIYILQPLRFDFKFKLNHNPSIEKNIYFLDLVLLKNVVKQQYSSVQHKERSQ